MHDPDIRALQGKRVAIANRAEIAVRIARTCRRLGAIPVLLAGEPDLSGFAARQIGRVEAIGPAGSEFDVELVVAAARRAGADFLHPGYGFLSERPALAEACRTAGITFIGPSPATLVLCGDKIATRQAAERAGVPVLPATSELGDDPEEWPSAARSIGYPLIVKPAGAGGGRGLRRVADETGLVDAIHASRRESASSGAGSAVYLERELLEPRHVEVQVAGDGERTIAIGDRDCSIQRRHQKVIEEAPAPNLDPVLRRNLHHYAEQIGTATGLRGIATCEFLLGGDGFLAFLEVNPRIQVEHPVTELVTGIDLVEWQLRIAAGGHLPQSETPAITGHAIEARVYAEDPSNGFFPVAGRLGPVVWPQRPGLRIDAGYASGDQVPSSYDPLIAKVIVHSSDRESAISTLSSSLQETVVAGIPTNIPWLLDLLDNDTVRAGSMTTRTAGEVEPTLHNHLPALLGAIAFTLADSPDLAPDAWTSVGPFRWSGPAPLTFHSGSWEESVRLTRTATGWIVGVKDVFHSFSWSHHEPDIWVITFGDDVMKLGITGRRSDVEICGHGGRWIVRRGPETPGGAAKRRRSHDGLIRAPLPAKVLGIHVEVGDEVEAAQPLVTLTAMKIEMICESPGRAMVESISCQIDGQVSSDDVMVTLRMADSD